MAVARSKSNAPVFAPTSDTVPRCEPDQVWSSWSKAAVPVALGRVIVLSAVGSVTARVVSWASAVAPSKTILPVKSTLPVTSTPPLAVVSLDALL